MARRSIMRAIHVIAGLRPIDGGPAYSVPRLCESLALAGAEIELMSVSETGASCTRTGQIRERRFAWDYPDIPVLRALRASSDMSRNLRCEARAADVIHNHGMWLLPNVYAGREGARAKRPLVIAPRGMLSPAALSFSAWEKKLFWRLLQARANATAACYHATSDQEVQEIRAFGISAPVAVIPNGIDVEESPKSHQPAKPRTVLTLGRIHPKKGLETLLRAWQRVESSRPEWRLRIVGPSEGGHDVQLKKLAADLGLARMTIEDAVYGVEKARVYREASLFVLSTLNENFGMTVAEALAAGVPVVATKGAPWKGLEEQRCGWWVDGQAESLATALLRATAMPERELLTLGERGRAWMKRDFSWAHVATEMLQLYTWLAAKGERPQFVHLN
ncbi:MAG TPA: glycosyltransferase [Micropepsaceae bacterium]|nr:glycosyltransferase [Micropepsaceae bacterium]